MCEIQSSAARHGRQVSGLRGLVFLVLLVPVALIRMICLALRVLIIHLAVLLLWMPRGRSVLFVYSESPNWLAHIEQNILPRLPPSSVVLNWSHRRSWSLFDLATWIFYHYGGYKGYNPLGIVIRPFRRVKVFRFWKPLRDLKHGKPKAIEKLEANFLQEIGAT